MCPFFAIKMHKFRNLLFTPRKKMPFNFVVSSCDSSCNIYQCLSQRGATHTITNTYAIHTCCKIECRVNTWRTLSTLSRRQVQKERLLECGVIRSRKRERCFFLYLNGVEIVYVFQRFLIGCNLCINSDRSLTYYLYNASLH